MVRIPDFESYVRKILDEGQQIAWPMPPAEGLQMWLNMTEIEGLIAQLSDGTMKADYDHNDRTDGLYVRAVPVITGPERWRLTIASYSMDLDEGYDLVHKGIDEESLEDLVHEAWAVMEWHSLALCVATPHSYNPATSLEAYANRLTGDYMESTFSAKVLPRWVLLHRQAK